MKDISNISNQGDVPKATFTVDADLLAANEAIAREFCNLHGLWASQ